jgi:hypothetical protein
MEITVFRDPPVGQEERALPAVQYNLARLLQARSPNGVAFVPIRSMQMLAILDDDEFVFLDSQYKSWVEVSWQNFRPQARGALDDPVPWTAARISLACRPSSSRPCRRWPARPGSTGQQSC